jgi:hypothetical protein
MTFAITGLSQHKNTKVYNEVLIKTKEENKRNLVLFCLCLICISTKHGIYFANAHL